MLKKQSVVCLINVINLKFIDIFKKKWQDKTNKELKKLRLAKLTNNNISESDMVNIRQLAAIPAKNLRQIARLRNISQNL